MNKKKKKSQSDESLAIVSFSDFVAPFFFFLSFLRKKQLCRTAENEVSIERYGKKYRVGCLLLIFTG